MERVVGLSNLSLNALRAFSASAKHLSFTRAAEDLFVTQAAVSQQVKGLEAQLGVQLFRRSTRGLVLTDEGVALAPALHDAFERLERAVSSVLHGGTPEVLTIGVVSSFALGILLSRLKTFRAQYPLIDVRLLVNNNKVDPFAESLDGTIRFGDGAWRAERSVFLQAAALSPVATASIASKLKTPRDLARFQLFRSYRLGDWPAWLAAARCPDIVARGVVFDTSHAMVHAALQGEGVALVPTSMFAPELGSGRLVQPFALEVDVGGYWLTRLKSKVPGSAFLAFEEWLLEVCACSTPKTAPRAPRRSHS